LKKKGEGREAFAVISPRSGRGKKIVSAARRKKRGRRSIFIVLCVAVAPRGRKKREKKGSRIALFEAGKRKKKKGHDFVILIFRDGRAGKLLRSQGRPGKKESGKRGANQLPLWGGGGREKMVLKDSVMTRPSQGEKKRESRDRRLLLAIDCYLEKARRKKKREKRGERRQHPLGAVNGGEGKKLYLLLY